MDIQTKLKRNLEIIDILSEAYSSLFFFNFEDGSSGVITVSKELKDSIPGLIASCEKLEDVFKAFILDQVHPDDRDLLLGIASRSFVAKQLAHQISLNPTDDRQSLAYY